MDKLCSGSVEVESPSIGFKCPSFILQAVEVVFKLQVSRLSEGLVSGLDCLNISSK